MDKQMIKYVGILVGLILLLVVYLLLQNAIKGGTKYSYPDIEKKMVAAAKKYVQDKKKNNIDVLPDVAGERFSLSSQELVNAGYLNELASYAKDEVVCYGNVDIYNAGNGNFDYAPELNCGDKYETKKLVDVVTGNGENIVTSGSGLYQRVDGKFITDYQDLNGGNSDDFEYVFRGDSVNNYVKIDDNIWRIVAIDAENNMLLIYDAHSQRATAWDEKYNEEEKKYQGVNTYESNGLQSNAYKSVQEFYNGTMILRDREKYSDKTKYYITPMNLCIGKRSTTDSDISGKLECQVVLNDQLIGLLPAYYYMSASLDSSCDAITSKSCGNYNYLSSFDDYWWLLTANSENTNEAYTVSKKYVEASLCNYKADIRPMIKVGSRLVYSDGDGTKDNPYQVKFFNETK